MKIREVMSHDPICCVPGDKAQNVAKIMRERNVGSLPVVADQQSRKLIGMITDRDLCCSVIAEGLDARNTPIDKFINAKLDAVPVNTLAAIRSVTGSSRVPASSV